MRSDLFNALDPGGLQRVLLRLLEDWALVLNGDVIAIDGKSLRRSFADAAARSPVHPVQAFAARLMLGQVKVDDRSNEIAAMPKLLEMLALKGNQGSLYEDVRLYLDEPAQADKLQSCQHVDGDHGRIETRRATVCHEIA